MSAVIGLVLGLVVCAAAVAYMCHIAPLMEDMEDEDDEWIMNARFKEQMKQERNPFERTRGDHDQ